jgi:hypothetical protein
MARFTLQDDSRPCHIPHRVTVPVHTLVIMVKVQHLAPFGLVQADYFIWQLASRLHSDCLRRRHAEQRSPLFRFVTSRGPRVLLQRIAGNVTVVTPLRVT